MANRENNPYKTFKILSRIFSLIALIMIGILIFGTVKRESYIETDARVIAVDSRLKTDGNGETYREYYAHILYTIDNKEYDSYYTIWGPNSVKEGEIITVKVNPNNLHEVSHDVVYGVIIIFTVLFAGISLVLNFVKIKQKTKRNITYEGVDMFL